MMIFMASVCVCVCVSASNTLHHREDHDEVKLEHEYFGVNVVNVANTSYSIAKSFVVCNGMTLYQGETYHPTPSDKTHKQNTNQ